MIAYEKKFILNNNPGSYFEIILIVFLFIVLVKTSFTQTATWDGSSSTDWNTAANWSTNAVPTNSNDVIIPNVTNNPIITSSSDECHNLTIQSGGVLTSNNGSYKLTAASITVDDGGSLIISDGEIECTGKADIDGLLTVSGSGATLDINGELELSSTTTESISNGNITVVGDFDGVAANNFTPTGGTLTMDGSGADAIISMHTSANFNNLIINSVSYDVDAGSNFDVNGTLTVTSGTLDISSYTATVSGATDIDGTLKISTGIYDANSTFTASGGNITFTDAGFLKCALTVSSIGTLSTSNGTVVYDRPSGIQNVTQGTYNNLTIDGNASHQIGGGSGINVLGNFVVNQNGTTTFDVRDKDITVSGTSDINGTLEIGTGTFDANGSFDATGGTIDFTGAGRLQCANTVTSLGTLDDAEGTVEYDGASSQTVVADTYFNLELDGDGTGHKSAGGAVTVNGSFTITSNCERYDTETYLTNVIGASDINSMLRINDNSGVFDADGSFDATGGEINFTTNNGTLRLATTPTSLGTLDDAQGKVVYNGAAMNVLADTYHDLTIKDGNTKTSIGTITITGDLLVASSTIFDIVTTTCTVTGSSEVNGTLKLSTGIFDANGSFTASGGTITFTDAGFLKCSGSVSSLGSMNTNAGTVVYDATSGTQDIRPDSYYNLTIDGDGTHQIESSSINVLGNLVVNQTGTTVFDVRQFSASVTGSTDIDGTIQISTGTFTANGVTDIDGTLEISGTGIYDSNGDFDATNGSITFSAAGFLKLSGSTITSFGTFTRSTGTVEYDGGDQSVIALSTSSNSSYNNLIINGTGTKTLAGTSKIYGDLTLTASDFDINGKTIYLKENMNRTSGNLISGSAANITIDNSGSHNICAFSDDDITIKTTSTGGSVTTTGDISCKSIDLTSGSKTFLIDGETVNLDEDLVVTAGTFQMTSGVLNINSNSSTSAVVEGGTLDLDGGTLTVGNSTSGDISLTSGSIDISGGTLNIADELDVSNGTVTQSGGTINIKSYIGSGNGSSSAKFEMDAGTLNLTGGTLILNGQTTTSASSNPAMKIASGVSVTSTSSHTTLIQSNNTTSNDEDIYLDLNGNDLGALTVNLTGHEVIINSNVTLNGNLTFTSGDISTNAYTLTLSSSSTVSGADDSKHLNGTCAKTTSSTSAFTFPVGDGTRYRPIILTPAASNSNTYSVEYNHSPHSDVSIAGGSTINHISPQYHWDINRTSGSDNATISVAWTSSSTYGTENWNHDISTMLWAYFDGSDWNSIGSTASGSSVSGSLTTSSVNSNWGNENFTLAATNATFPPLPVDIISFNGQCDNNFPQIEFVVASQINNEFFTIERSVNLIDWEEVGYIAGGGTTNEIITYNWSEEALLNGTKYYRLSLTDINDDVKYSNPIAIECENEIDFHLYPNPAFNFINIAFNFDYFQNEETNLNIRTLTGKIIKSVPVSLSKGYNNMEIDLKDLPKGIYLLTINSFQTFRLEKRFIKM